MGTSPKDDEKTTKEIAKWTTGLMNTSGGWIVLYCNTPYSDGQRDRWLMGLESVLINNWIPESTFQSLVRFQYLETDDELRIYMFVCKSPHKITFAYNAYSRQATGIRQIRDPTRIRHLLNEPHNRFNSEECNSPVTLLPKMESFQIDAPIPTEYRESQTMEFKHCYCDKSKRAELHSFGVREFWQRLHGNGGYIECMSAFANSHGGSLVLGVEEGGKFPVVRGLNVAEDEKQKIHDCLKDALDKCIWHGGPEYKPRHGQDWNVLYHDVKENGAASKRHIIEIRIAKHTGGMFLQTPIYYIISNTGTLVRNVPSDAEGNVDQSEMFDKWTQQFLAADASEVKQTDVYGHFRRHTDKQHMMRPPKDNMRSRVAASETEQDLSAGMESGRDETKLPKSFRQSQSEHKSDITVHSLHLKDCCTVKMARSIQALEHTKTWYPQWETKQKLYPGDVRFSELIDFVNKEEWSGVASVIGSATEAETNLIQGDCSLICHVLIIRKNQTPILICCLRDRYREKLSQDRKGSLVEYALIRGRFLKQQYLASTVNRTYQSCVFHFEIQVLVVPDDGDITKIWDSRWTTSQPVAYPHTDNSAQYYIACIGLAEWLLKTRFSVKDRYGDVLTEHLTEAQARILFDRSERVLIVSGKSGTGKTVIALHLVNEALRQGLAKEDVLYICSNEGLAAFVRSQVTCRVMVLTISDGLKSVDITSVQKALLVVVDDVHAIRLARAWGKDTSDLYTILLNQVAQCFANVAIFFDPEQDFQEHLPTNFDRRLRGVAESVGGILPEDIKIVTLSDRIRNSREINRFMQANQNQAKVPGTISCLNEEEGDDVTYEYIGENLEHSSNVLNARLDSLEKRYSSKSIAILFDDAEQAEEMKTLLQDKFKREFQTDRDYPVCCTVLCNLADFGGLEADVILFLLPARFGTDEIKVSWKYVNVISSRAKLRLEFLLPWEPKEHQQTEQEKIAKLVELFKTVRLLFVWCRK